MCVVEGSSMVSLRYSVYSVCTLFSYMDQGVFDRYLLVDCTDEFGYSGKIKNRGNVLK